MSCTKQSPSDIISSLATKYGDGIFLGFHRTDSECILLNIFQGGAAFKVNLNEKLLGLNSSETVFQGGADINQLLID